MEDVVIIGGGAAGLGAALYCARFTLKTTVIAKDYGGTGNIAHLVDNWIGEPGITGPDLMQKFVSHVKEYKVPLVEAEVESIKKIKKGFVVKTKDKKNYESKTILFANGMTHRKLGVPGEKEFAGKGVHYCYSCDGPLYPGKTVAIIGGGDAAALGTLFMEGYAKKIYVIYRGGKLRAEPISAQKVYKMKKAEVIHNTNVVEIYGDKFVKGIKTDTKKDIKVDAVFVEIGHLPLSALAKSIGVKLDAKGFIPVDKNHATNIHGVFAAGDITNATSLKQFITSAAEGSIAAQGVYYYLQK
ncbi:MAG: FAD-dependent oxidoreductase [bacterium]|nr:FAD-dependent oxidoreductase [bacterium]